MAIDVKCKEYFQKYWCPFFTSLFLELCLWISILTPNTPELEWSKDAFPIGLLTCGIPPAIFSIHYWKQQESTSHQVIPVKR